jgi:putative transposase
MISMLVPAASKSRHLLQGANQLPRVIEGINFTNGIAIADIFHAAAKLPPSPHR